MEVTFKSTYQIPLSGPKLSKGKAKYLIDWVVPRYKNVLITNNYVKLSISEESDNAFEQKLRQIGFKVYQKFFEHDIPKNEIEKCIAKVFREGKPYKQYGKQPKARR